MYILKRSPWNFDSTPQALFKQRVPTFAVWVFTQRLKTTSYSKNRSNKKNTSLNDEPQLEIKGSTF